MCANTHRKDLLHGIYWKRNVATTGDQFSVVFVSSDGSEGRKCQGGFEIDVRPVREPER